VPIFVAAVVVLGALVAGGSVLAASSTDASVNNYQQCANDKPGSATDPTDCVPQGWINGILNANNSQYTEDQVTAQRLGLDVPSGGPLTGRTITIKYLARKGQGGAGNHAYDSLATWNITETNADRCQGLAAADCPGGSATTFQIPVDNTVVADSNGAGDSTANHELADVNRQMTMYGGTITGVSAPVHDNASGSGDDYAQITVTYSVAATPAKVQLLFGGHLAASVGPRGWGDNVGSSFINGGPYHVKLVQVDTSSIGNRDNQITSGAILPTGTQTQTALHETDATGVDVNPANNEDPLTQTGITVTLPANGSGTYVTDYATVAPTGSTGTVAFRYYSSQAACTTDTAFTGGTSAGSGKALDVNGVAKSNTVHITTAGVTYWRAVFTGAGLSASSDSGCNNEILTANQATSTATTLHETTSGGADVNPANNGDPISIVAGGYVTDYASVTPNSATGSVAFKYYGSLANCTNDTSGTAAGGGSLSLGSAHSSTVQFNSSGTFYWKAFFTGTNNNNDSQSGCEVLNVRQPTTTNTTLHETTSGGVDVNPANNGDPITVTMGGYVTDYASVTPASATGSVAFKYYGSLANCTNDTSGTAAGGGSLSSGSAHSNTVQFNSAGTFYWKAFFTGTGLNNDSHSGCEVLQIPNSPTIATTLSDTEIRVGGTVHDSSSLSGATSGAGGTVTYTVYTDSQCTQGARDAGTVTVTNGNVPDSNGLQFNSGGTFYWQAVYSGDNNNKGASSACTDETLRVISPHITILKTPDQQTIVSGQTATFTIQVINDGDSNLTNVVVTDALAPGCARTSADIPGLALMKPAPDPSGTITYTCTLANVTASFTNTAVATGKPEVGPNVSSQDTAAVTVVQPVTHPAISIVKDPKSQTVTSGGTATFTITVLNTGDVTLTNVVVTDALSPNCNKTIGTLAPGQSVSYKCTRPNVKSSFTNVAVVTGQAGSTTLTAQDTAPVTAKAAPLKPKTVVKPKVVSHRKPKATG
jgi:uncharacterized repeat protein (TIGR01451 family)